MLTRIIACLLRMEASTGPPDKLKFSELSRSSVVKTYDLNYCMQPIKTYSKGNTKQENTLWQSWRIKWSCWMQLNKELLSHLSPPKYWLGNMFTSVKCWAAQRKKYNTVRNEKAYEIFCMWNKAPKHVAQASPNSFVDSRNSNLITWPCLTWVIPFLGR